MDFDDNVCNLVASISSLMNMWRILYSVVQYQQPGTIRGRMNI